MLQKKSEYKPYPRIVRPNGKEIRVNSAEEEAEVMGCELEEVLDANKSRTKSPDEKLAEAKKLFDEAQAEKKAASEMLDRAKELNDSADDKLSTADKTAGDLVDPKDDSDSKETETKDDSGKKAEISSASEVTEGDKDSLEAYAAKKFSIDLDKRKSFSQLLEIVQAEEAKNA